MARKTSPRIWQLRLAPDEDDLATKLANDRMVSKNDVLRRALRLLAKVEQAGGQLYVSRHGKKPEPIEVWLL